MIASSGITTNKPDSGIYRDCNNFRNSDFAINMNSCDPYYPVFINDSHISQKMNMSQLSEIYNKSSLLKQIEKTPCRQRLIMPVLSEDKPLLQLDDISLFFLEDSTGLASSPTPSTVIPESSPLTVKKHCRKSHIARAKRYMKLFKYEQYEKNIKLVLTMFTRLENELKLETAKKSWEHLGKPLSILAVALMFWMFAIFLAFPILSQIGLMFL